MKKTKNSAIYYLAIILNLTYSTGDFNASKEIYKEGKIATNQNIPALVALAEKLKAFPTTKPQLPIIDRGFVLDTIIYNNFSRAI